MSNSDHPTFRPVSGSTRILERLKNLAHALAVIFGAASATCGAVWVFYSQLATDTEVKSAVQDHDRAITSHPLFVERLASIESKQASLQEDVEMGRAADVALGSKLVSLIAADREPTPALRAAAASFYREEYARLVRKGEPIEDALLEALRTPWHHRQR